MDEGVVAYFTADGPLTELIGERFYPEDAEAGAGFPRVVYAEVEAHFDQTLTGPSGLGSATYDLTAQSERKADVVAAVKELERLIEDASLNTVWGAYRVSKAWVTDKVSDRARPVDASDRWVYWTTVRFQVLYARI